MWKILLFLILLSAEAQQLKFNKILPNDSVPRNVEAREDENSYRLPNNTEPQSYLLSLVFGDFHNDVMSFTGDVTIVISVVEDTQTITLHSGNTITLNSIELKSETSQVIPFFNTSDTRRDFLTIFTPTTMLTAGSTVILDIKYTGVINSETKGIFRGNYQHGTEQRYFIASHMQPTFFRLVCPSYDEPSFKARFRLLLWHNNAYRPTFNTPVFSFSNTGAQLITIFEVTSLLPTYLLGLVVSDFDFNAEIMNGIPFAVFSRPAQVINTQFALENGMNALDLFESAFETKRELEKLDQVALPGFNRRGSMENDGIIFYDEDILLVAPGICHKFLGNLLTPHWWSVVWLSEGFCRFYEYYMTEKIYPDMRKEELFAVAQLQDALKRDSTASRPMTSYAESPEAVAALFDFVAYSKSASVIGMFLYSLSEATFHKGLKIYLSKSTSNPAGVAKPEHLYEALQQAANEDGTLSSNHSIAELFGSWETQAGFPMVFVERSYNDYRVRFTQNRFTNSIVDDEVWDSLWHIPITYASKANPAIETRPKFWLSERRTEIELDEVKPNSYLLVNLKQTGYYRVQYDDANWMLIAEELSHGNFSAIPPNNRAMLIDDAAAFVEKNMLQIRILLELVKYLEYDIDYIPWLAATNNLEFFRRMLNDGSSKLSADFQRFLRVLVARSYNTFGAEEVEGEPHYHKHARNIAINWACQAHLEVCTNETRDKLNDFIARNRAEISVDHKSAIFCNGNRKAGMPEFETLWSMFLATLEPDRRHFYLKSMACIENEEILTRLIETIIDDGNVIDNTNNEWLTIMEAVSSNGPIGLRVVLNFLRTYYDELMGVLGVSNSSTKLVGVFEGIAERINTAAHRKELSDLLGIFNVDETTIADIESVMEANLKWINRHSDDIQDFLDDFFRSASSATTFSCFVIVFGLAFNWIMQN